MITSTTVLTDLIPIDFTYSAFNSFVRGSVGHPVVIGALSLLLVFSASVYLIAHFRRMF